jgi:hypothetical protein
MNKEYENFMIIFLGSTAVSMEDSLILWMSDSGEFGVKLSEIHKCMTW